MPLPSSNIPFVRVADAPNREAALALFERAKDVWRHAYKPYSKFGVGTAILTGDGQVFVGCNAETANYNGGHGEQGCIMHMHASGIRNPIMVSTVGALEGGGEPVALDSCGMCRQWIYECASLSDHNIEILVRDFQTGDLILVKITDYLPRAFGPADIGVDLAKYRK